MSHSTMSVSLEPKERGVLKAAVARARTLLQEGNFAHFALNLTLIEQGADNEPFEGEALIHSQFLLFSLAGFTEDIWNQVPPLSTSLTEDEDALLRRLNTAFGLWLKVRGGFREVVRRLSPE